nr:pre-glycoprotein polyprotein GP complex [Orthonairovirus dugbeense]
MQVLKVFTMSKRVLIIAVVVCLVFTTQNQTAGNQTTTSSSSPPTTEASSMSTASNTPQTTTISTAVSTTITATATPTASWTTQSQYFNKTTQRHWREETMVSRNPTVLNRQSRASSVKELLNTKFLMLLGFIPKGEVNHLENACNREGKNCTELILKERMAQFFSETEKESCYNTYLEKHLCSVSPEVSLTPYRVLGLREDILLKEIDRRIIRFEADSQRVTCLSASLLKPDVFIREQRINAKPSNGPKIVPVDSVRCINLEANVDVRSNKLVIQSLMTTVKISLKNCKVVVNSRQCIHQQTGSGVIKVPKFEKQQGGTWSSYIAGVYTATIDLLDENNQNCKLFTKCIVKGRELVKGQSELKSFNIEVLLPRVMKTRRKLLAVTDGSTECNSGTQLIEGKSIEVHKQDIGGPGKKLTICNGTSVLDVPLDEGHGCYTINVITSKRACRPKNSKLQCSIDKELKPCDSGKCLSISQKGAGHIKVSRGKTILITECKEHCQIPVPTGKGDIMVDCSGGRQHYLEVNIVDIHCPNTKFLGGIMLYFCRMSSRPTVALLLGIWIGCGYILTCIFSFLLYHLILFFANCIKQCKKKGERLGEICVKCEQQTVNLMDQELHDLNCSFNLCPYCCNRMSDEGMSRHVGKCPKRLERLNEIELYLNYKRVPSCLRCMLSTSISVGIFLKRTTWLIVLLVLLGLAISPVQGAPIEVSDVEQDGDYSICYFIFGCLVTAALLLKVKRTNSNGIVVVVDSFGRCPYCNEFTDSLFEEVLHDTLCSLCVCPFCEKQALDLVTLEEHVKECYKVATRKDIFKILGRKFTNALVKREKLFTTGLQLFINKTNVVVFALIMCFLLLLTGHNASAFDSGDLPDGIWEESSQLVKSCTQFCYIEEDVCYCPAENGVGRKLLFFNGLQNSVKRLSDSHKLLTSISIDAPWGAINVESTWKPTLAASNIAMSWSSTDIKGEKVILSGRSTSIIKLKEKTGVMWELGSELASEKKKLLVSIMDFAQVYNSVFQYITGDRLLSEWPKAVCTGDCPHRCGCQTSTCMAKEWPHTRNWRCNPTWCWGIGTGCTCCGMDVERPFNKYLGVKWSTEYLRTEVLVCVEVTEEERHCEIVEAGTRFNIGPITITISDPQNIGSKLPESLMTVQEIDDSNFVDIMHVGNVISADNSCRLQSCTHGSAGDYQIYSTDSLIKDDHSSGLNLAMLDPKVNSSWLSWEGCDMDYYCNVGDWPTCTYTGVVTQNSESFSNLINIEKDYTQRFHFHSKRISAKGHTLQLDLKARPNQDGGEVTALIEVDGMELHSKTIRLSGIRLTGLKCSGCFSCTSGISCSVNAKLTSPDEFTLHLRSTSPDVVVAETSIIARKGPSATTSKFKVFSVRDAKKICFEVVEREYCKDCSPDELTTCTGVELEPPKDILLEHRGTIVQHQNDTCKTKIDCWSNSISSFASGIGDFFKHYIGSIAVGILGTVLPFALLILFFIYGDKMLWPLKVFCRPCRKCCRKNEGYNKLAEEEELRDIIRKFSKSGELINKDAKDKRTLARLFMSDNPKLKREKKLSEIA